MSSDVLFVFPSESSRTAEEKEGCHWGDIEAMGSPRKVSLRN